MEDGEFRKKWMGLVEIENGQLLYSPLSKAIKTKVSRDSNWTKFCCSSFDTLVDIFL